MALGSRWPREFDHRTLVIHFITTWRGREADLAADDTALAGYMQARAAGDFDTAAVYAGEALDLMHAIEPAGRILDRIVTEANAALAQRYA